MAGRLECDPLSKDRVEGPLKRGASLTYGHRTGVLIGSYVMAKGEPDAGIKLERVRGLWAGLRAQVSRLLFVFDRRRLDDEARLEIDAHLDLLTERYRRQGLSPDEAYVAARRRFGNATLTRQDIHALN